MYWEIDCMQVITKKPKKFKLNYAIIYIVHEVATKQEQVTARKS